MSKEPIFIGESVSPKDFLIACRNKLYILDNKSNIKKEVTIEGEKALDFKQDKEGLYSYCETQLNAMKGFEHSTGWYSKGNLILLDEDLKVIKRDITLKKYGSVPEDNYQIHCHDHLVIDENHYFLLSCVPTLYKGVFIMNCIVQEQLNDKVIWQFESIQYPGLFESSFFHTEQKGSKPADYAHMNSIQLTDGGKSLIFSFRNIGVIKVDYATRAVIWILGKKYTNLNLNGKVELNNLFKYQHDFREIEPNTYTVFNNDDDFRNCISNKSKKGSTVCKFKIEDDSKIVEYTEYPTNVWSGAMGCAIHIKDDIYDVCYGMHQLKHSTYEEINFKTGEKYLSSNVNLFGTLYRINRGI